MYRDLFRADTSAIATVNYW